jgi:hypothetical protein
MDNPEKLMIFLFPTITLSLYLLAVIGLWVWNELLVKMV